MRTCIELPLTIFAVTVASMRRPFFSELCYAARMKTVLYWLTIPSIALSLTGPAPALDSDSFKRLHSQLQPDASGTWRQIPWQISVLEGQRLAARENKPLFIWAMDGHPLGCT